MSNYKEKKVEIMTTVAIVGGTLIDGTGADPVSNVTLIIENDPAGY